MHNFEHVFLFQVDYCQISTAYSGWLCRWINIGDWGAIYLYSYGLETNFPFVCMELKVRYEFRIARMLLRLQHSTLDDDYLQNLYVLHVHLYCFDYPVSTARFLARCTHFRKSLDLNTRFVERHFFLLTFVLWHCVETYLMSGRNGRRFYSLAGCPDWPRLKLHRSLRVATPPPPE